MKKLKIAALIILSVLCWTAFVAAGFVEGFLLRPINGGDSGENFIEACEDVIEEQFVGNFAIGLVENGKLEQTFFYSHDDVPIDENSAFPVASISKWVTAVGVLQLVREGKFDLDTPIDHYLTRWHLPESEYDNRGVTIRRLLSHSAGLDDDLGYGGFSANESIQSIEESLTSAADGYYDGAQARVGYKPGNQYMYSGAGYTLLQLLIEEVSGKPFSEYMNSHVFIRLGMTNSSYLLVDSTKIGLVDVYKSDGSIRPMKRFTAKAAASLMTSIEDLSKFMIALVSSDENLLSEQLISDMTEPTSFRNGHPYYGLGPHLYSGNSNSSHIIGHDGSGNDAINSAARVNMKTGNGIIILETGHFSIASDLADEWMFWQAGIADRVVIERNMPFLITILAIGYAVILIASIWFVRKRKESN